MSATYPYYPNTSFPDSVQTLVTMLDVLSSDAAALAGYQQAMEAGDTALAQQWYAQISNASQKIIDAQKLNTLIDTCMALEEFYRDDIQQYLVDQQDVWEDRVNQFNYQGTFSTSKQYELNNFVAYTINGVQQLYICIARPPIGVTPTSTAYWRVLTVRGDRGPSGTSMTFRYEWSSSAEYEVQDIVTYNNSLWGCLVSNQNQTPQEGSTYWQLIYNSKQTQYPVQAEQPGSQTAGDLWFKVV